MLLLISQLLLQILFLLLSLSMLQQLLELNKYDKDLQEGNKKHSTMDFDEDVLYDFSVNRMMLSLSAAECCTT